MRVFGRSRQSIYSLKKKAQKEIDACDNPVLEMIEPYVHRVPLMFVS